MHWPGSPHLVSPQFRFPEIKQKARKVWDFIKIFELNMSQSSKQILVPLIRGNYIHAYQISFL